MSLGPKGFRLISVSVGSVPARPLPDCTAWPAYESRISNPGSTTQQVHIPTVNTHAEFVQALDALLLSFEFKQVRLARPATRRRPDDGLSARLLTPLSASSLAPTYLIQVHLMGVSLGGYLAQCYAQYMPKRVASLMLINSFCDTSIFKRNATSSWTFPYMPEFYLKRYVLDSFPKGLMESDMAQAVDFMVMQLDSLGQAQLSSRLLLNCCTPFLKPLNVKVTQDQIDEDERPAPYDTAPLSSVTIIDSNDDVALPDSMRDQLRRRYPFAKVAYIKSGGDFPYLSRSDEINMLIQVHLRKLGYNLPQFEPAVGAGGGEEEEGEEEYEEEGEEGGEQEEGEEEYDEEGEGGEGEEGEEGEEAEEAEEEGA